MNLQQLHALIADDAYAITFPSMAGYRSALLAESRPAVLKSLMPGSADKRAPFEASTDGTDGAREYLVRCLRAAVGNDTFTQYIRAELAGDFALAVANACAAHSLPLLPRLPKDERSAPMAQALKLVSSAAVRAEHINAERIDSDFLGIERKLEAALDAEPIHDDLRKPEGQETNDRTNPMEIKVRETGAVEETIPEPTDDILCACGWETWNSLGNYVDRGTATGRYRTIAAFVLDGTKSPQPRAQADASQTRGVQ